MWNMRGRENTRGTLTCALFVFEGNGEARNEGAVSVRAGHRCVPVGVEGA